IFSSPVLVFMLVYSIFFAGLVAITTNNFGSLVRYKIAVMPFFLALLVILLGHIPRKRNRLIGKYIFSKTKSPASDQIDPVIMTNNGTHLKKDNQETP
ncbi:MAG: hypothetical protein H7Y01_05615, partial [Ferruginibacter sp.]|nr:hypothetical protein [Chitinophagaceae bacterium]